MKFSGIKGVLMTLFMLSGFLVYLIIFPCALLFAWIVSFAVANEEALRLSDNLAIWLLKKMEKK